MRNVISNLKREIHSVKQDDWHNFFQFFNVLSNSDTNTC